MSGSADESATSVSTDGRPRTIITADPELDDLNSMIRLLLYSNEMRIEGLIYASSRFHWRGDGHGTQFFLPDREYETPQSSWRWAEGEQFIHDAVDAYAQVHPNLAVHDSRYPGPAELRSVIREGNIDFEGDVSQDSAGAQLIMEVLLDDIPGPVFLQMWAGPSTVTRALMSIEDRFGGSEEWERIRATISARAIITKFASQDETYDDYINPRWPDIRVIDVATLMWGYLARKTVSPDDVHLLGASWMKENITDVGPLGALYRVWGDGRQMVPGDMTDYFHLSGHSGEELRELGYQVWVDPQPAGEWISEGDTTNMLPLLVPGLRGHEHPSYGGWGGRAARTDTGPDTWSIVDSGMGTNEGDEASVTRWFADAQRDLAARLQWSITPAYEDANHHPVLHVEQGTDIEVSPGTSVHLSASVDDPDGDTVRCRWWIYREAGTCTTEVSLSQGDGASTSLHIPDLARSGETIHIVVEARDDSEHPMTSYQRVILTVR